ncbi:MAG TPA: DegT/DnrJ/EryC1/StrS aminotransferase family protein [Solirubrobacteraceae bacterium]|jgi:dTDP-4-amino-4,6-dideoxygalactose transaminase|nr:DegT/DnrJ/EryC1/StrS aminotransferase family protein [Solirubrobacteraceae bacterium]
MGAIETSPERFIPVFDLEVTREDLDAVAETLRSGWLTMGPRTIAFETEFARSLDCSYAVAVSSCTAALHLAYLAAGVGPGDEVIVPSYTMAATAAAALYAGATPVFADIVGVDQPVIDVAHVEALIGPRTRAVVAMHFGGYAAAVDELADLCAARGISLLEDAAHSPMATLGGRHLGTFGLAGAFSFFSNKVLAAGEGGLLATDDARVAAFARSRRSHAMTRGSWDRHEGASEDYDVPGLGFNYRIDEPRAALLLSRLRRLENDVARRRVLTSRYRRLLQDIPGLIVPFTDEMVATSSCYVMPVMLAEPSRQSALRIALREQHQIQTSLFYPAVHEFTAYRARYPGVSLPKTELAARSEVTLPLYSHMTEDDQDRVVAALAEEL